MLYNVAYMHCFDLLDLEKGGQGPFSSKVSHANGSISIKPLCMAMAVSALSLDVNVESL